MTADPYRAVRRLERMLPEWGLQEHLRATDPERYEEHMRQLARTPVDLSDGIKVSETVETQRFENGRWVTVKAEHIEYNLKDGSEKSRKLVYERPV